MVKSVELQMFLARNGKIWGHPSNTPQKYLKSDQTGQKMSFLEEGAQYVIFESSYPLYNGECTKMLITGSFFIIDAFFISI